MALAKPLDLMVISVGNGPFRALYGKDHCSNLGASCVEGGADIGPHSNWGSDPNADLGPDPDPTPSRCPTLTDTECLFKSKRHPIHSQTGST